MLNQAERVEDFLSNIEGEGYDPENAINANFERVLNQLKEELIEPDFRR